MGSNTQEPDQVDRVVSLEVNPCNVDPIDHSQYLQTVQPEIGETGGIEAYRTHDDDPIWHAGPSPPPGPRPSIPVSTLTELPVSKTYSYPVTSVHDGEVGPFRYKRICGIRRLWFYAVLGLALCAIAAGLLGGLLPRRLSDTQTASSAAIVLSPLSSLAAVNWTTSYFVFVQTTDNSLLAYSKLDDKTWQMVNISQRFEENGGLGIRPNSPLAAVAISDPKNLNNTDSNQLRLYLLTMENFIVEIIAKDSSLLVWDWGALGPNSAIRTITAPGSQLAATWRRCDNATKCGNGLFYLSFEDTSQDYNSVNSTYNWTQSLMSSRLAPNSSSALISMSTGNDSDYTWGFFETNGQIGSAWEDYTSNMAWLNSGRTLLHGLNITTTQRVAATSFQDRYQCFLTYLCDNGTVIGKHWYPITGTVLGNWDQEKPLILTNSPTTTFSAVAMTADARFYGISNNTVFEYVMDGSNPYQYNWISQVFK